MYSCFYCSPISSDIVNIDGFNENIHFIHCFIRSVFRLHFMKINEIINRITGLRIISYGYSILISGIYRDRGIMTNVFFIKHIYQLRSTNFIRQRNKKKIPIDAYV